MIFGILVTILLIIGVSIVLFFLFVVLLPSLRAQRVNASDPLFSVQEEILLQSSDDFKHAETGVKAVVLCSPARSEESKKFNYRGEKDCSLFTSVYDSEYNCSWGCIGFGNCVNCCPRNAISIKNGVAVVGEACNGCGLCTSCCPQNLIKLIPAQTKECVLCAVSTSTENLNLLQENCKNCVGFQKVSPLSKTHEKSFQFWKKCNTILERLKI